MGEPRREKERWNTRGIGHLFTHLSIYLVQGLCQALLGFGNLKSIYLLCIHLFDNVFYDIVIYKKE